MAAHIQDYTFDFLAETERLAARLWQAGLLHKDAFFWRVDVTPAGETQPLEIKIRQTYGAGAASYGAAAREMITKCYKKNMRLGSFELPLSEKAPLGSVVVLRDNSTAFLEFGPDYAPLMKLFTLYHETSHAMIEGPRVDDTHPYRESAADAYAALCFLQRFGDEAKDFISLISWQRAMYALQGYTSHLSTVVLDKIVADSETRDFSKLSPGETVELAKTYAREWTPDAALLAAENPVFAKKKMVDHMQAISLCLEAPDQLGFYVAARFLQPLLEPEGLVQAGQAYTFPDGPRQNIAWSVNDRARQVTLQETFNKTAAKTEKEQPLSELLAATRRAGKALVFNPKS